MIIAIAIIIAINFVAQRWSTRAQIMENIAGNAMLAHASSLRVRHAYLLLLFVSLVLWYGLFACSICYQGATRVCSAHKDLMQKASEVRARLELFFLPPCSYAQPTHHAARGCVHTSGTSHLQTPTWKRRRVLAWPLLFRVCSLHLKCLEE